MTDKFGWLKTIGKKFVALRDNLELRAEEREAKRFTSMDDNPFLIQNRNKRFSTYRSELIHGVMLRPLDKFLDKEAKGEGSDQGLLGGLWHFKDDEDETIEDAEKQDEDDASEQT
tara:strand:- start:791 stop:1135 length:345 start_codon:yes stop_codon:yes gene_type:complete